MPADIKEDIPFVQSRLETIDYAVFNWLNDDLNIFATSNKGNKKVPVIWVTAERAYQIKNDVNLRTKSGIMTFPVITVERTAIVKSLSRKGGIHGNVYPENDLKGGTITIARQVNQYKSSNFINADSAKTTKYTSTRFKRKGVMFATKKSEPKVVYETITIPFPIYVEASYNIKIKTEYQQQMNEIMTPFISRPGALNYVNIEHDNHTFEAFVGDSFSHGNNVSALGEEERKYETGIDLRVLGYIVGDAENQDSPRLVRRQNFVEVKFPREHVVVGDEQEWDLAAPGEPFHRE